MGTSAFDPVILADVRSVRHKIDISGACGAALAVGDVVRYDPSNDYYIPAKANNTVNANFVGIVESITGTEIVLVYSGEINLPDAVFTAMGAGATAAQVFYLSDTNAGKMTFTAPSTPGSVIKPVMLVNSNLSGTDFDGIVINTAGDVIQGDSSVDLSDIQPVGSVLAFAGQTSDIPTGWALCDGDFLDIATYADLYAALDDGKIYGFSQVISLSRFAGAGPSSMTTQSLVGKKFYYSPTIGGAATIECTFLSGTVTTSSGLGIITNAEVAVDPTYSSGTSVGLYHGLSIGAGGFVRITTDSGAIEEYTITSAASAAKFRKPDLRSRFIIGESRGITGVEDSGFNTYFIGRKGGEESHVLTSLEMPIHTHTHGLTASITGNLSVSHTLATSTAGAHTHLGRPLSTGRNGDDDANASGIIRNLPPGANAGNDMPPNNTTSAGAHTHTITGDIFVSAAGMTPVISGTIDNAGGNNEHNNVPQHVVMYWIIKTRKDSVAKLFKLGPSGGGAIIAKNTAKRWARASSGAGCTVDISYASGSWTVSRLGTGDYRFTHDMVTELGTADQEKYIVEATVIKNGSGATQMFLANPYSLQGLTFGVKVYDVMGATFSDNFQYLSLTIYGGGTAL
jgi:microcystin-dependent protein